MGCVSSKIMTRSRSFHEELSLSLRKRTNGMPGLEDIAAGKSGGGEQFLALLSTANTLAAKLRAEKTVREQGKFSAEAKHDEEVMAVATKESDEPTGPEVINAWELMADLEQEETEGEEEEEERGQEWGQHLLQLPTGPAEGNDGAAVAAAKGVSRSRSFRTVEEFDAMVSGNCSIGGKDEEEEQTGHGNAHKSPDIPDAFKRPEMKEKTELADIGLTASSRSSSMGESAGAEAVVVCNRSFPEQKGMRRRSMAKELMALKVPSFEFNSVGSLREWLGGGGQVVSPGSYVTPKFGNFISPLGAATCGSGEDSGREEKLFDPQLVADLEEAMERLTMEEEHILRQIVDSLQGEQEEDDGREDGGST